MHGHAQLANVISLQGQKCRQPLLLQAGMGDGALRYFAPAVPVTPAGEFLVYVAESSLLLDLVRLKRVLEIVVHFGDQASFNGELTLAKLAAPVGTDAALALTLVSPCLSVESEDERCCPIT